MPLILNHGWPWTFWDLRKVIRSLSDPATFGGDPADAFHVVVPSGGHFAAMEEPERLVEDIRAFFPSLWG